MLKTGMIIAERYEILGKIGTGGMADVYKAKDHKLNRFVAVKVLKPEFREDTTFIRKFRSEAQAAAVLTHPNIVNVFDVGDDNGVYYIVMELIEGITLKEYISKKGKLSVKEATSIAIQVSMGLEAAHSHGIVHRDVKPQNIIISREGKVKVLVNVNILTEGVDLPQTKTVFLARPTVSTILMTQMIGRALRGEAAGGTSSAYIVSFVDNWNEHIAWVNPDSLFSGNNEFTDNSTEHMNYA